MQSITFLQLEAGMLDVLVLVLASKARNAEPFSSSHLVR